MISDAVPVDDMDIPKPDRQGEGQGVPDQQELHRVGGECLGRVSAWRSATGMSF